MMIKNFFFFTATILNWFKVLENDSYKDVIIESFRYLVDEKHVKIFALVKGKLLVFPKVCGGCQIESLAGNANFWEHQQRRESGV